MKCFHCCESVKVTTDFDLDSHGDSSFQNKISNHTKIVDDLKVLPE